MAPLDYTKLRNHTLDSNQDEEAVTVNTRALIDKVLARYSGEFTTLRELIQNAADASAKKVDIKFESLPSASTPLPQTNDRGAHLKHTMLHHSLCRLVVTNDGQVFGETDWARLKRIAEGNPDETKIGAFGVGFYSVFSECESPFVTSGGESMAFYWKGNSLFTRKGALPAGTATGDTSFVLGYRSSTTAMPNFLSICKFLSTCLTFIGLEEISVMVDDWDLFSLRKKSAPSVITHIPPNVETMAREGIMAITGVESQHSQIDAKWINIVGWTPNADKTAVSSADEDAKGSSAPIRNFFSRMTKSVHSNSAAKQAAAAEEAVQQAIAEDIAGISQATMFIRVHTVKIKTFVKPKLAAELERATKKPPPKQTQIAILTSSLDETEASISTRQGASSQKVADVILSALPTKGGQIFIGFPTSQTTGLLAHVSAPSLIPTVERESIDLNARHVKTWNSELLSIAGIACRIAYTAEMVSLKQKLGIAPGTSHNPVQDQKMAQVLPAANHLLQQFTFREATPLPAAGMLIEESFWGCGKKKSIDMISTCGILPSNEIRMASENLSFVSGVPVVPEEKMRKSKAFIDKLVKLEFLSQITTLDIKQELGRQALAEDQLSEFMKWAAGKLKSHQLDITDIRDLFSVTLVHYKANDSAEASNLLLELRNINSFVNVTRISPDLPTPPDTIAFRLTKGMPISDLETFSWGELQLVPWLRWLVSGASAGTLSQDENILRSAAFSARVLATISKGWDSLSQSSKETVTNLLGPLAILPTRLGMRKPADTYFASVKLFDDLPIITNLNSVKEKFLKALGVRKTIELAVIFDRLMRADNHGDNKTAWSHVDLIKYLVSVWNDIPEQDINQLRGTALCPAEIAGDKSRISTQRYQVNQLYEPSDTLRALGLNILQWPGQYNSYGPEGKFLKTLGLRTYPSAPELIDIVVTAHRRSNSALSERALLYYLTSHYSNNYAAYDLSEVQIPFLPLEGTDRRAKPRDCVSNPAASVFGYSILRKDLHREATKLGVQEHPQMYDCALKIVRQPPQDKAAAKVLFEYFASRLADISPRVTDTLGAAAIVPISLSGPSKGASGSGNTVRHTTPKSCFIGHDEEYADIFDYVNFGDQANLFLMKVGSKQEPTLTELTRLVIREPTRILDTLQAEKYQGLLRKMHFNLSALKKDKTLWGDMKKSPFLLGYVEVSSADKPEDLAQEVDGGQDEDDAPRIRRTWHLRSADKLIVVDDLISYNLFKTYLVAAPQEEGIEELYSSLGTPNVSTLIDSEPRLGPRLGDQRDAEILSKLVLERAQLFLHEQPPATIQHDLRWLEKHLEVQTVQAITLRRKLRGSALSHQEKRSAAITAGTTFKNHMMSITPKCDIWQVSQALAGLLLSRPKTQTIMVLENFLTTRLETLRARGYNVDRILRKKAAEARFAEFTRQKLQEDNSKRARAVETAREQEKARIEALSNHTNGDSVEGPAIGPENDTKALMPGAFKHSPDRPRLPEREKSKGFLSSITQSLGLGNTPSAQALQNMLGNNTSAPAPSELEGRTSAAEGTMTIAQPPATGIYDPNALQKRGERGPQAEPVSNPGNIEENLQRAIAASRSHGSDTLFSPPRTTEVKEVATYCDSAAGHNLKYIGKTSQGLPFFVDQSNPDFDGVAFTQAHADALGTFSRVLKDLAGVFGMPKHSLHIFYDTSGGTIAFNASGSIFANFRFFSQLHLRELLTATDSASVVPAYENTMKWWWATICHELAHNIVGPHGSEHSYYTEQFVARYFSPLMARFLAARGKIGVGIEGLDVVGA